jgi:hypothetical protein
MDNQVYHKHETLFIDKLDCTHVIVHRWVYQDHINEINLLDGIFNTKESLYYAWIMIVAYAMDEFIFMNSLPHRIKNCNKNEIDNMNDNECPH